MELSLRLIYFKLSARNVEKGIKLLNFLLDRQRIYKDYQLPVSQPVYYIDLSLGIIFMAL